MFFFFPTVVPRSTEFKFRYLSHVTVNNIYNQDPTDYIETKFYGISGNLI